MGAGHDTTCGDVGITIVERPKGNALVVDDDEFVLRTIGRLLRHSGLEVTGVGTGQEALDLLGKRIDDFDVLVVDVNLPDMRGPDVVEQAHRDLPNLPVILMSGQSGEAARLGHGRGAYDFLEKPFDPPEALLAAVDRALERKRLIERTSLLEGLLSAETRRPLLVGEAPAFKRAMAVVDLAASADSTVLLLGESGTGKELVARAVHLRSVRRAKPFVAINCAALSESVVESELFGHARGAFTGAVALHKGIFEQANRGTIFLDEIGELALGTQAKLLRVLEERRVRPIGATVEVPVDVRVVAATHRDLRAAVREGRFREDLFYRLNVIPVQLPPLRDRREDIPLLVQHLLRKAADRMGRPVPRVSARLLDALSTYEWPGNVRELHNVVERCFVLSGNASELSDDVIPDDIRKAAEAREPAPGLFDSPFDEAISSFQRAYLANALRAAEGNITEASRRTGVERSNLRRMLKRHRLLPSRQAE